MDVGGGSRAGGVRDGELCPIKQGCRNFGQRQARPSVSRCSCQPAWWRHIALPGGSDTHLAAAAAAAAPPLPLTSLVILPRELLCPLQLMRNLLLKQVAPLAQQLLSLRQRAGPKRQRSAGRQQRQRRSATHGTRLGDFPLPAASRPPGDLRPNHLSKLLDGVHGGGRRLLAHCGLRGPAGAGTAATVPPKEPFEHGEGRGRDRDLSRGRQAAGERPWGLRRTQGTPLQMGRALGLLKSRE